jgi:thiosulfate dehydrogenase [quinone] large subunit
MHKNVQRLLAATRIGLGWIFFWAFIDKLFGLGFATPPENAWLAGGSPTAGFLQFATVGPLAGFYQSIAGHPLVDALFMFGLFGLGIALLLGIGMKIAGVTGPLLMLLMWSAHLPPENNPILDDHIIYGLIMITLSAAEAGETWGLGHWWSKQVAAISTALQ